MAAPLGHAIHLGRGLTPFVLGIAVLAGVISLAAMLSRRGLVLAWGVATLLLLPLAIQWISRIGFVVRHGGMDCAHCQGSPLLFLWAWIIETIILLPGTVLVALLIRAVSSTRGDP